MSWFCVTAAAVLLSLSFGNVSAATLDQIKKRGSILIAVKSDYKPWGFADESSKLQGMEVELARNIAERLKVKLVLVPAVSARLVTVSVTARAEITICPPVMPLGRRRRRASPG